MPDIILSNISVLLPLLDSDSYHIRNAIVTSIAHIILCEFTSAEDPSSDATHAVKDAPSVSAEAMKKTRDTMLNVLHERAHDINAFSRATVLKMWSLLCQNGAVPLVHLPRVTSTAIDRLRDRTVNVRKNAMQLLSVLLECNPYMGNLSKSLYMTKLDELEAYFKEHTIESALDNLELEESPDAEYDVNIRLREFYGSAIQFIVQIEKAVDIVSQLLHSQSSVDASEAVQLVARVHKFHVDGSEGAIRSMLVLIWRSDESIRNEVIDTCRQLFLYDGKALHSSQKIALNLISIVQNATIAHLTSLEQVLSQLDIPAGVMTCLWEHCISNTSHAQHSLCLLGMAAAANRKVVSNPSHLNVLLKACHSEDSETVRLACLAIQKLQEESLDEECQQLVHKLIRRLTLLLALEGSTRNSTMSCGAAEQMINTIFALADHPERFCEEIIKKLSNRLFGSSEKQCKVSELAHFFFVLGHVALKVLVHIEDLAGRVKRLRQSQQSNEQDSANTNSMEDELGLAAEIEAEDDAFLQDLTQKEIVGRNLLGAYGPLVIRAVANPSQQSAFNSPKLMEATTLTLCKFMCISSAFCEKNLPLLFTKLRDATEPTVRANIMIALGDLCFRFPNLIEPWTSHLYNRLRDEDVRVRKNTLMVLTHLILNDMVKVKAHVTEIVLSIKDENPRIEELAKVFFHELSKRGNNPIYNLLPDTISQLSSRELPAADFRELTKFLLNFINKDRQAESLVEKLCQRFTKSDQETQWRDIAYCLSLLPYSTEKTIKKLIEMKKVYKNLLHDDEVYDSFTQILSKARKSMSSKTEVVATLTEFETELQKLHDVNETEAED